MGDDMLEPVFSENAKKVIEKRYLVRDDKGRIAENAMEMLIRVASDIAAVDGSVYGKTKQEVSETAREFYGIMALAQFLPNSPTLMNAGTSVQQLAACFVLPVDDTMEDIFDAVKYTALIHKSGGGTGFDFSRIRPKSDIVKSTGGEASGPISFMKVFNSATEEVKQGGKRRGANMGILRIDHPDILEFITCKDTEGKLNNFNISVAVTEEFMKAYFANGEYDLYNPRNKSVFGKLKASSVFDTIVHQSWKNGEPGIIFIDRMNEKNPTPNAGRIESTNPCGEQPLLPNESCNLGSINLEKFVSGNDYDHESLRKVIHSAVHFLDNVIDATLYPLPQIEEMTKANRKIGLGVMGYANSLISMGIPYDTEQAVSKAKEIMKFIDEEAKNASHELAMKRGSFTNHEGSVYKKPMRNATVTTIAPTGTISMIADTSSGIEPLFGIVYKSRRADTVFLEVNPLFERISKERGFYFEGLYEKVLQCGTVKGIGEIPEDIQEIFVTSGEIDAKWHIEMQAAFQMYTDNAVSKTINFPNDATKTDIKDAFLLAYKEGCKGITVYRDGSRDVQVLSKGPSVNKNMTGGETVEFGHIVPRDRPRIMHGMSQSFSSSCSKFYVTVNGDDLPFEVFYSSVGQSGCPSQTNAIAILTTLLLRSGVAPDEITKRLERIVCSACVRKNGVDVASCPAAIGNAIETFMKSGFGGSSSEDTEKDLQEDAVVTNKCPDCGSDLVFSEGCRGCTNPACAYHKCG
jgi:ribonucleoside-diphosphate reductase alpha chain